MDVRRGTCTVPYTGSQDRKIRMLYKVLSKRLERYMTVMLEDAEECDAVNRYDGMLVCVEGYMSRNGCGRMFRMLYVKGGWSFFFFFVSEDVE